MEDRRKIDSLHWDEINKFIAESRIYRAQDAITQKYQVENIEALKEQVKIQNGRVTKLEKWQSESEVTKKDKKDSTLNTQALVTVICAIVMAVSAIVMLWKH